MTTHDLISVLRPNSHTLWIDSATAQILGVQRGDRLTPEQMSRPVVADLIARREQAKKGK